jgi:hypothetical protein
VSVLKLSNIYQREDGEGAFINSFGGGRGAYSSRIVNGESGGALNDSSLQLVSTTNQLQIIIITTIQLHNRKFRS